MDNCIYLGGLSEELTYNSQEHLIPAGLGGRLKLPKGFVSDQANEKFSKYELFGLRKSLLTGNRMRHGPGKRGNQNIKKEKAPVIRMLKENRDNGENLLGYIFAGEAYVLPQIRYSFNYLSGKIDVKYVCDNFNIENLESYQLDFRRKIMDFLFNEIKSYNHIDNDIDKNISTVNIGLHKGKWYLATNISNFDMDKFSNEVIEYTINQTFSLKMTAVEEVIQEAAKIEFKYSHPIDITSESFGFIFVKTAFNALAYLVGQEIASSNIFDELRNDIINCRNLIKYIQPSEMHGRVFSEHIQEMPQNAHCVYLVSKDNMVYSYVSFYNEWHAHMVLSDRYNGEDFVEGFVCDWKAKKEYRCK
ncbi:hypothetical protein [Clostridium tagluense]|uniref:hypothetical protein n=1 Tax=Clostridium tagluense TaxID=360422 RepID=UPI001C6E70B0|nr:hypothetical protein [Clostridium tagluense]MBW9157577.1 hypothetical protein [Clostridium tagluense]WLC65372.1 hypothetical protein KTC93_21580 [Clostridium tagluense]